jgi:lysophospholipase L1-like esterase
MKPTFRPLPFLPVLALLLLLTAPALAQTSTSAPAALPARDKDHFFLLPGDTVVWLGDSITAENRYPTFVDIWGIRPWYPELSTGDKALKFINKGISGDTANGGLARLDKDVINLKPTVCVVCFGMNHRGGDPNYAATMLKIVQKLKAAGIVPVLLTSSPTAAAAHKDMAAMAANIKGFRDDLETLAKDENVLFIDCFTPMQAYEQWLVDRAAKDPKNKKVDFTWGDGIHPNAEGHVIMAQAVLTAWGLGKPLAGSATPPQSAVFWDGDRVDGGQGWAGPAAEKTGKAAVTIQSKESHGGKKALAFTCDGAKGVTGAWNLYAWAPNNNGLDASSFAHFSFWIKLAGDNKPDALKVYLDCAYTKTIPLNYALRQTPRLDIAKYCPNAFDGQWHEVLIPLKDLQDGKTEWDPHTVCEFGLSAPAANPATFTLYIDDLTFKN